MDVKRATELVLIRNPRLVGVINKLSKWKEDETIIQNCKNLNISVTGGYQLIMKYSLVFKKKRRGKLALIAKESVLRLNKAGFNMGEIARLLKCSRQRIYQLLQEKTF